MGKHRKSVRKTRNGFLQRTAAAVALCVLSGLLLIIPGISSDDTANTPAYSHWQTQRAAADDDIAAELSDETDSIKVGSFKLTRPRSELFMSGLSDEWVRIVSSAAVEQEDIEKYLSDRARTQAIDSEGQPPQFRDWLMQRGEGIEHKLLLASADYAAGYLTAAASDSARGMSFIRTIEWDYQSELGERRWQSGLSALGALRESDEDAIVWQLRGYAAQEDSAGANAGLIYRRAVDVAGGGLAGVNAFLDYEKHGDYDEDFLRWSLGGEYRSTFLDLYVNRYFPISDAVADGNDYIYTQGGYDVQANLNAADFGFGDISGGLTYYWWEGEYGDDDSKGLRYHLRFSPARGNLRLELELDSPDGGSTELGGNISYRYTIGSAVSGGLSASSDAIFDARAHFFDSVRREYAQRIRRSGEGGGPGVIELVAVADETDVVITDSSTDPVSVVIMTVLAKAEGSAGDTYRYSVSYNASITTAAGATLSVIASDWTMEVYDETSISLLMSSSVARIVTGTVSIDRSGNSLDSIIVENPNGRNITITLRGTQLVVGRESDNHPESGRRNMELTLYEGTIQLSLANAEEGYIDIEGVSAVAMVEYAPDPLNNPNEVVMLMAGCASPQQRNDHKLLDGVYNGCAGDAYISSLAVDQTVYLTTQGEEIILVGVARGVNVDISVYNNPRSTEKWGAGYPFYPPGAVVRTSLAPVEISYTDDNGMTAIVSLAGDSSVQTTVQLFHKALEGMQGTITAAVLGGDVQFDNNNKISCPAGGAARTKDGIKIFAACNGTVAVTFDGGHTATVINGAIGVGNVHTLPIAGGDGNYTFSLSPPGGVLSLVNVTGAVAMVSLSSAVALSDVAFQLHAAPLEEVVRSFSSTAVLGIRVFVTEGLAAAPPTAPAIVRTRLDGGTDLLLRELAFVGKQGDVTYDYSTAPAGLESNFAVIAGDNGNAARVSLVQALTAKQRIEVVVEGTDTVSGQTPVVALVTLTVDVQHPGVLSASENIISPVPLVNDHALYDMAYRGVLVEISDVGNEGLSGINNGYDYELVAPNTSKNLFEVAPAADPAESAELRVIPTLGTLPAGAYILTVRINDEHDDNTATPALDLVFSVSIVPPLALNPASYEANINSSQRNEVLATVTVAANTGAPPYTYRVGDVEPSDVPADLFAVNPDGAGNGVISFTGSDSYNDTELATVNIIVEDALNGASQTFILSVSIFAPLASTPPPQQVIHQSYDADFYTFTEGRDVSGGSPPYTYNLTGILTADGFVQADFALGGANNSVLSAAGDLSSKTGVVTLRFGITDSINTPINDYRLTVTVSADNIQYTPPDIVTVLIRPNHTGEILNRQAGWSGTDNHGAFSYGLGDVTPLNNLGLPLDGDKLGVNSDTGALNLNGAIARVGETVTVEVEASEDADNVTGFPPATLTVKLAEVGAIQASGATLSYATHASEGVDRELVKLSVSSGGTGGAYTYEIVFANPSDQDILGLETEEEGGVYKGVITQLRAVSTAGGVTISVRITDTDDELGSMVEVPVIASWSNISALQSGQVVIGGIDSAIAQSSEPRKNDVWTSPDGKVWTERTVANERFPRFQGRGNHAVAVLNNTLYISGGEGNGGIGRFDDVWFSTDAINWTQKNTDSIGAREGHAMFAFNNSLYVVGGTDGNVPDGEGGTRVSYSRSIRKSADGVKWEDVGETVVNARGELTPGEEHPNSDGLAYMAYAVHNDGTEDRMYLLGGFNFEQGAVTEVRSSTDGRRWRLQSGKKFPARANAAAVSFKGVLYVIGGTTFGTVRSDVWKLTGTGWEQVVQNSDSDKTFGKLENHAALVQGDKMFVIGGRAGHPVVNRVWSSTDGATWTLEEGAKFDARTGHVALVYPPESP